MSIVKGIGNLAVTVIASVVLIFLGVVFFMLTVWMIKIGATWAGYPNVSGATVVLTAGIISAASMIGSSIQK